MQIKQGYTIVELILGVLAMTCIMLAILPMFKYYTRLNQAQALADQSINYSKIFVKYLLDNDNSIRSSLTSSDMVVYIKWSDIVAADYVPSGNIASSNLLGQTPCMAVGINSVTNQLTPYLFFVGGGKNELLTATTTMQQIGAMAGVYTVDIVDPNVKRYGSGAYSWGLGWYLLNDSNYISGLAAGCEANLSANSLVINLAMMTDYINVTSNDDLSLHRYQDNNSNLGESNNTNTLHTDITMSESGAISSHKLYFSGNNESSGMYLFSDNANQLVLKNGGFAANTLQAKQAVATFSICSAGQLGTMAQQVESNVPVRSQLQCSYDALQCQGNDPLGNTLAGYCYLPVTSITINYKPNTSSFTCPTGYIDNSIPPVVSLNMPALNTKDFAGGCNFKSDWDSTPYVDHACYPTKGTMCIWAAPELKTNYIGVKSSGNYKIYTGVSYTASWDWVFESGNITTIWEQMHVPFTICPQLTGASLGLITSVNCTTTNPVVSYESS